MYTHTQKQKSPRIKIQVKNNRDNNYLYLKNALTHTQHKVNTLQFHPSCKYTQAVHTHKHTSSKEKPYTDINTILQT